MPTARFDEQASTWDEAPHRVLLARDVAEAIAERLPLSKGMEILDFGCGTGLLSLALRPSVGPITGADTSKGMLEVLEKKLRYGGVSGFTLRRLEPGQALKLGGPFHLVVSSMTLHHVENVPDLLKQLREHLQPGGWIALADLASEDGSFHADPEGVFHQGFSKAELKHHLENAGFGEVQVEKAASVNREKRAYPVLLALGRAPRDVRGKPRSREVK